VTDNDSLQRFLFDDLGIRGQLVHLDASLQAILRNHPYPAPVARLLGETAAAALLLSGTIKFDGTLTLQAQGDGPINLVVVQATAQRTLRGMARWQGEVPEQPLHTQFGKGYLAVTIDPGLGKDSYQGIVTLDGDSLATAIETYFQQSEQLPTRIWLTTHGDHARGLLLQAMPGEQQDPDGWNRISLLANTLSDQELQGLPSTTLLQRLFHEENLRLYDSEPVSFRCTCSRERIENTLRSLGQQEITQMIEEQNGAEVTCEFCNQHYRFDSVDLARLFTAPGISLETGTTRH